MSGHKENGACLISFRLINFIGIYCSTKKSFSNIPPHFFLLKTPHFINLILQFYIVPCMDIKIICEN